DGGLEHRLGIAAAAAVQQAELRTLRMANALVHPFFTIGHSTRSIEEFVGLLKAAEVAMVVDVRTVPRSRTNPQFNRDTLPDALAPFQIGYQHFAPLGGLRGKKRDLSPEVNGFWRVQAFHNYADYALGEAFRGGLAELRDLG